MHNWADQDEKAVGAGREEREEHSRVRRRRMDAWVSGCGWVRVGVSGCGWVFKYICVQRCPYVMKEGRCVGVGLGGRGSGSGFEDGRGCKCVFVTG